MNAPDRRPSIVIGVDFGMFCTGVAYSKGPDWAPPKCLLDWPELDGSTLANKVRTRVGYDASGRAISWGLLCDPSDEYINIREYFKLYLDPAHIDAYPGRPTVEEAKQYFKDYMKFVFTHIDNFFKNSHPRWDTEEVEFLFSIPTTWKNPNQSAEIERLINEAGFGGGTTHRQVKIAQTEAEAAAVYAAKGGYKTGDVVLVCDAGGGTTDVNILKVTASAPYPTQIKALTYAEGKTIGSVLIDLEMEKLINGKLRNIPAGELEGSPDENTRNIMKSGRFERIKLAFGSDAANVPSWRLPVPGLRRRQTFQQLEIETGSIVITKASLEQLFDTQFHRMSKLIDEQIRRLGTEYPNEHLTYMVLSGGLGSSPYIQRRLRTRYGTAAGAAYPNAQGMEILLATEPQLAVVQGMVMDRIQALSRGTVIYKERCCRQSYGVVGREPYDPIRHRSERVTVDPFDKKRWAEGQILWIIKKGEIISKDGISVPYKQKIPIGQEDKTWEAQIVTTSAEANRLPQSMTQGGSRVEEVCRVEFKFDPGSLKLKNHQWYKLGHQYSLADFDVRVIIGPADLKFQLVTKEGHTLSDDHKEIEVTWDPPRAAPRSDANVGRLFPRTEH